MTKTIEDLAAALGMPFEGDGQFPVGRASDPSFADSSDLAVALSPAYSQALLAGDAQAAIIWSDADWRSFGLKAAILADVGRLTLPTVSALLADREPDWAGHHPTAVIHATAVVGTNCSIGPYAVVGPNVRIGAGALIEPGVTVGRGVTIGRDARLGSGCRIGANVLAGDRLCVQPGAVIGADGFSFVTTTLSNPERAKASGGRERLHPPDQPAWHKTMSLGSVILGDDVEVGANSTIDAGTLKSTRIGNGTKLDNLVHVGHNVDVGEHCLLCGMTGVAGSVTIGNRVVLGGQTGVADHNRIGDDVVTGAGTMIQTNVVSGSVLLGYPAQRMDRAVGLFKTLKRMGRDSVSPRPQEPKTVPKSDGKE